MKTAEALCSEITGNVEHDVNNHRIDLGDVQPVLRRKRKDRGFGRTSTRLRGVEFLVHRKRADAGDKIGCKARRPKVLGTHALNGPSVFIGRATEAVGKLLAGHVCCHCDERVRHVERCATRPYQSTGIEQTDQEVVEIRVSPVDFVEQEDAVGLE